MENKRAVVVLSGGMDSTTLLYDVLAQGYNVKVLSFDYNQKHKRELECARATCEKLSLEHKVVDLAVLNQLAPSALTRDDWKVPEGHYTSENMKETVVPNRNMVMLSLAVSYAIGQDAGHVFYGAHAGDHEIYADCRKDFVTAMQNVAKLCDFKIVELHAPYLNMDKGDIAIRGIQLGVDYLLTHTCYKGKEKACGKCGSCTERLEAFEKAGVKDPIKYEGV